MRFEYKDNLPIVTIVVAGVKERSMDAHLDFASSMTIIPREMNDELRLEFSGYEKTATGGGVILMPVYEALVKVFGKRYRTPVGCLDLPEGTPIKALLGRDILDEYNICLNGRKETIEVSQS